MQGIGGANDQTTPFSGIIDGRPDSLPDLCGRPIGEQLLAVDVAQKTLAVAAVVLDLFQMHSRLGFQGVETVIPRIQEHIEDGPQVAVAGVEQIAAGFVILRWRRCGGSRRAVPAASFR